MTRYVFQEVAIKGVFRWRDADGKNRQETRKFMQTINPFNKGADGQPKGYTQIMQEIRGERDLWLLKRKNDLSDPANAAT